jgi:transcriptional regulator with XRE-family HTH domain
MKLTQAQLADRLNITPRYLKAIENSGRKPSYDLLVRMVRELDIPADMVFYPEQGSERPAVKIFPFRRIP